MSSARSPAALIGFALLAGFVSWHWFALVADVALWRWGVCLAVAAAVATALATLSIRRRGVAWAAAALVALAALAASALAIGVPADLLAPANWGRLRDELASGLSGVSQIDLPYAAGSPWTQIGILLAAPATLVVAAALAFWPAGAATLRRAVALILLVALYGVAVSWEAPSAELARGIGLLIAVAMFLWLPRMTASRSLAAFAAIAIAGLAALPAAARVDTSEPVVNYKDWRLFGAEREVTFNWNHSYGPLDWPQRGTELFEVRGTEQPLYWKTWVLDEFDGVAWGRGDLQETLADPGADAITPRAQSAGERWRESFEVSVRALRSPLLVSAGTTLAINGVDAGTSAADGTTEVDDGGLIEGDSYAVEAYVPNPTEEQLKARDDGRYPRALERSTTLILPQREGVTGAAPAAAPVSPLQQVVTPLRDRSSRGSTRELVAETPYAPVEALARRLTRDATGTYEAVLAIERHLLENYEYVQEVPERAHPLPAFLFRDRAGYCQQFSGAMALLLRLAGIPSRVVSGFAPGLPNDDDDGYVVRDTDAHSWVEVWFPRIGWATVDPTPSAAPARTGEALGTGEAPGTTSGLGRGFSIEEAVQSGPIPGLRLGGREEGSSWSAWIASLLVLFAVVATSLLIRSRRRLLLSPAGAEAQLRELERALRTAGLGPMGGATLLRLEREVEAQLGRRAASYLARLRDSRYRQARPRRPGPAERSELRRALTRGRGPRGRLRLWLAIPPGGPRRA